MDWTTCGCKEQQDRASANGREPRAGSPWRRIAHAVLAAMGLMVLSGASRRR